MAHKEYVTRRRSDFTMWNLQLPEDVDKKLDRANMYLGVIADVLADIADILTAKQAALDSYFKNQKIRNRKR